MKFKPYPKYKASGVEWLGDVPEHWDVRKLAHAIDTIGSGTTPKTDTPEFYLNGEISWVNTGDLNDSELYGCSKSVSKAALDAYTSLKIYPPGSVVMAMYGATIGKLAILRFPATVNQACCVFVGEKLVHSKFLFYWLCGFRNQIVSLATGGGQPNISQEIIRTLRLACPNLQEQAAIAELLDREAAKIDTLIAKQEAMIDLLKEKRKAVISHAVTKGLDPNVPMKSSGVDWLGDVPEHWITTPLKHIMTMTSGGTPAKNRPEYWNGPHPWASAKDLKVEVLDDTQDHISDLAVSEGGAALVPPNAVLIVVRGMILLHTLPVTVNAVPMAINQDLKALRSNLNCDPGYLAVLLRGLSKEILGRTDQAAHGTKALREDDWTGMHVPLPPITEQIAIAQYISSTNLKINALIAKAEQAIALQKEHRTALISAAVTGKIDVREAAIERKAA